MPQTIVDLGKRVKAKYPGEYDDLSDEDVGRKVKAKYPGDYDDFVDTPTSQFSDVQGGTSTTAGTAAPPQQRYTNPLFGGIPTPQAVMDFAKGIPKGPGELIQTGGQWMESMTGMHAPSWDPRTWEFGTGKTSPSRTDAAGRDIFEPKNRAEALGKIGGQTGTAIAASLAAGPAVASQMAAGPMIGALMNPDNPYPAAAAGVAIPATIGALGAAGRYMTDKDVAAKLWNAVAKVKPGREGTALDITAGEFKALPGRAMVGDKGTVRNFLRALTSKPEAVQKQAAQQLSTARSALASELAKSKTPIDVYANVPFDENAALKKFADALKATDLESANLSSLTPTQANALRSDLGNRINWNPNVYNEANNALKETYFGITENIETRLGSAISPHLKRLQEALLYNKALAHEIERRASRPAIAKFLEALKRTAIPVGIGAAGVELLRD